MAELQRERLLSRSWLDLVDFSSATHRPSTEAVRPNLTVVGRLVDEVICQYTVIHENGRVDSVSGGPILSGLDSARLQETMLDAVFTQRKSIGIKAVGLRASAHAPLIQHWSRDTTTPAAHHLQGGAGEHENRRSSFLRRITILPSPTRREVRWDEYAEAYDVMCSANPAYSENLDIFKTWIGDLGLTSGARICDVGAGTGNYALEIARRFPDSSIVHLDSDPIMNRSASRKYRALGADNVGFATSDASLTSFAPSSFDLIVCVNALYTFESPERALAKFHLWLKTGGFLFLIDLGRLMDVADWSRYIIMSSIKRVGLAATARAFFRGRKAIGQNRLIRQEQQRGRYWMHTTEQLATTLQRSGFDVAQARTCYRDVCDLAVCRKPR